MNQLIERLQKRVDEAQARINLSDIRLQALIEKSKEADIRIAEIQKNIIETNKKINDNKKLLYEKN